MPVLEVQTFLPSTSPPIMYRETATVRLYGLDESCGSVSDGVKLPHISCVYPFPQHCAVLRKLDKSNKNKECCDIFLNFILQLILFSCSLHIARVRGPWFPDFSSFLVLCKTVYNKKQMTEPTLVF